MCGHSTGNTEENKHFRYCPKCKSDRDANLAALALNNNEEKEDENAMALRQAENNEDDLSAVILASPPASPPRQPDASPGSPVRPLHRDDAPAASPKRKQKKTGQDAVAVSKVKNWPIEVRITSVLRRFSPGTTYVVRQFQETALISTVRTM